MRIVCSGSVKCNLFTILSYLVGQLNGLYCMIFLWRRFIVFYCHVTCVEMSTQKNPAIKFNCPTIYYYSQYFQQERAICSELIISQSMEPIFTNTIGDWLKIKLWTNNHPLISVSYVLGIFIIKTAGSYGVWACYD